MKTRVIVAVSLLPLLLIVVLACPAWATALLVAAMAAVAVWELLHTAGFVPNRRIIAYSVVMAAVTVLRNLLPISQFYLALVTFLYFVLLALELLAGNTKVPFSSLCVAVTSALMIPWALAALVRIRMADLGKYYIIAAFVLAFTSDTGAYFVGCKFGKHKLAPVISPKKTVEGFLGGILSCVVCMLIYAAVLQFAFDFCVNYFYAVIYGAIGSVVSVLGDLVFSVVKRQAGIKDYGKLMPGHGGVLDRFDSTVFVAPLTELLIFALPLIGGRV